MSDNQIINLKSVDIYFQIILFIFMIGTILIFQHLAGLGILAMATEQCLSIIMWQLILRKENNVMAGGKIIRMIFIIVLTLLAFIFFCLPDNWKIITLYAMIGIGPILGFSYFIITVAEIYFYERIIQKKGGS